MMFDLFHIMPLRSIARQQTFFTEGARFAVLKYSTRRFMRRVNRNAHQRLHFLAGQLFAFTCRVVVLLHDFYGLTHGVLLALNR